jgi:hypothetical protein
VDADFWLRQWAALVNAPVPCLIFLALGLAGAWWFRGSVDHGETRGLRAQIEGLKEQINAWEQRLKLASEHEQAASKATQSAKDEITTLKEQMANKVSAVTMATTTASIEGHLVEARRAQEQVSGTLQPSLDFGLDFTVGSRVFHQKFGYGRITNVDGKKLSIHFELAGDKRIMANYVEHVFGDDEP